MPLLCWIINDRSEKARIKKRTTDLETYTTNQVIDRIKKALEMEKPSRAEILTYLYTLQATHSLSNLEFFDIIGKTFQYLIFTSMTAALFEFLARSRAFFISLGSDTASP